MLGALAARTSWQSLLVLSLQAPLLGCGDTPGDSDGASGAAGASSDVCPNDLPDRAACADGAPSYAGEVAPIIDERCNACHYPGNAQTTSVWSEYDAVYAGRRTIQSRIYSCVMPPETAPQLTPAERAVLLEWLVCGAPEQ